MLSLSSFIKSSSFNHHRDYPFIIPQMSKAKDDKNNNGMCDWVTNGWMDGSTIRGYLFSLTSIVDIATSHQTDQPLIIFHTKHLLYFTKSVASFGICFYSLSIFAISTFFLNDFYKEVFIFFSTCITGKLKTYRKRKFWVLLKSVHLHTYWFQFRARGWFDTEHHRHHVTHYNVQ